MAKHIQAYFRTEDEAEGARTSLLTFHTEQLEVGQLDAAIGRDTRVMVPLVPYNTAGGVGTNGAMGVGAAPGVPASENVIPVVTDVNRDAERDPRNRVNEDGDMLDASDVTSADYSDLHYVLSAKVRDEDYDAIVHKLRSNHAYVEELD
ncbi:MULTISPECIES: hypothetical protein [Paenibacillus]|uniref:Uncharacterized protein n=1 Tax=Paenibacillus cucumis (ex Kampfer et al. 2016) TaxID=1776858 RepID=A0ABS7KF56_9BACL|nr:hypothetical protein [Paenibacillus cucumis (ex Kampfer et al. 2016)]MBY0202587.1 hypothetical protein [Paenibacillus cucumis (ex Kampfer et al. 2016)]MDP9701917.1 hypothetical protein [Paenibacillus intestini]